MRKNSTIVVNILPYVAYDMDSAIAFNIGSIQ